MHSQSDIDSFIKLFNAEIGDECEPYDLDVLEYILEKNPDCLTDVWDKGSLQAVCLIEPLSYDYYRFFRDDPGNCFSPSKPYPVLTLKQITPQVSFWLYVDTLIVKRQFENLTRLTYYEELYEKLKYRWGPYLGQHQNVLVGATAVTTRGRDLCNDLRGNRGSTTKHSVKDGNEHDHTFFYWNGDDIIDNMGKHLRDLFRSIGIERNMAG